MSNLIAHRGLNNKRYKENTLIAAKEALSYNYIKGIEVDIRLTKDKKLVVIHDMTINRTSNGSGFVKNMTLKELKNYNFGNKEVVSRISTIKDFLRIIPKDKLILLEIKHDNDNEEEFIKCFYKAIRKFLDKNVYIMSFNESIIKKLKAKYNFLKCGLLISTIINAFHINDNFDFIAISSYSVKKVKDYKKEIFVWALNSKKKYQELEKSMPVNTYYIVDTPYKFK